MIETAAKQISPVRTSTVRERILAYVELTKPRIALMLVLTSAAGFYLGTASAIQPILFVNAMVGIALLAFGVATLNQWVERSTDRQMTRTATRPLPSGRLASGEGLVFGLMLCLVAEAYLFVLVNTITAVLGLVVIIGYVLLYTPLKRITSASTAIGAIPGAMPPLMGWTAAANEITLGAWSLFAVLAIWQFPHFLAIAVMYKDEYERAGIKMLPVVDKSGRATSFQIVMFSFLLLPVSLAPFFLGIGGVYFLAAAIILGVWFFVESVIAAKHYTAERSRRLLMVSVIYLPLYFLALTLNH